MQQPDPEYYRYLRVGKLADSLTIEEEKEFEQLLKDDKKFREEFTVLQNKFSREKLSALERFKNDEQWGGLMSQIKEYKDPLLLSARPFLIGIAIVIVCAAGWFFIDRKPSSNQLAKLPAGIQLKLANGKLIPLDSSAEVIREGNNVLSNSGKALTYSGISDRDIQMNSLTVAPGLDYKITLSDGTKVWMNSITTLDFPFIFPKNAREISINGEAYLEVAPDAKRPFIVHLPTGSVQVLGTEFNVNTYESGTSTVSLLTGSIALEMPSRKIILVPGRQATATSADITETDFNAEKTLSWQKGIVYFNGTPLASITKVISRWFGVQTIIDNSRNADKLFVGVVNKNRPLAIFLHDLQSVADIDSYFDKQGVLHFR